MAAAQLALALVAAAIMYAQVPVPSMLSMLGDNAAPWPFFDHMLLASFSNGNIINLSYYNIIVLKSILLGG